MRAVLYIQYASMFSSQNIHHFIWHHIPPMTGQDGQAGWIMWEGLPGRHSFLEKALDADGILYYITTL